MTEKEYNALGRENKRINEMEYIVSHYGFGIYGTCDNCDIGFINLRFETNATKETLRNLLNLASRVSVPKIYW